MHVGSKTFDDTEDVTRYNKSEYIKLKHKKKKKLYLKLIYKAAKLLRKINI